MAEKLKRSLRAIDDKTVKKTRTRDEGNERRKVVNVKLKQTEEHALKSASRLTLVSLVLEGI